MRCVCVSESGLGLDFWSLNLIAGIFQDVAFHNEKPLSDRLKNRHWAY
jgi:hypothetical protein